MQNLNVLVYSNVMYDMLREVRTVLVNSHCFILSLEPSKMDDYVTTLPDRLCPRDQCVRQGVLCTNFRRQMYCPMIEWFQRDLQIASCCIESNAFLKSIAATHMSTWTIASIAHARWNGPHAQLMACLADTVKQQWHTGSFKMNKSWVVT